MPSINWIERNLGNFTGCGCLLDCVWRMDVCASDRYFTITSFFLLNLFPKRTSFDEILVDARVVADPTTPCLDTTEIVRGMYRKMEVDLHKIKFDQLLDDIKACLLIVLGFAPEFHSSDTLLPTPGDQLEGAIHHGTEL